MRQFVYKLCKKRNNNNLYYDDELFIIHVTIIYSKSIEEFSENLIWNFNI
jgi:2'-5' RNA ligase